MPINTMRVISGKFKGRRLSFPLDPDTRATSDKVKEALFNILADKIHEAAFLDLYAGSGSIGIEAISRGAGFVVFVEKNKKNVQGIKKNLSLLQSTENTTVVEETVLNFLKENSRRFDIVYVDPPYVLAIAPILRTLDRYDILAPGGLVIVEHFHKTVLPDTLSTLSFLKRYRYGGTVLSSYVKHEGFGCLSGHV